MHLLWRLAWCVLRMCTVLRPTRVLPMWLLPCLFQQVEVHRLVWFVGILSFTVAMILFVIGLIRKMDPLQAFVNGFILVVVANVPEVREGCGVTSEGGRQGDGLPHGGGANVTGVAQGEQE